MNIQDKIEKLLCEAPRPSVPKTLFDELKRNIPVRKVQERRGIIRKYFATTGGAISRWRLAAIIGIMALLPLSYGATKLIKRFITISQLTTIEKVDFPYYSGKALSPDGKHFAGITQESELVVIDTSTGEQRNLGGDYYGPVVWSADGSEIAMVSFGQEKAILVAVSPETGKTRTLMEDPPWLADWSPDKQWILGVRIPKSGVHSQVIVNLESKEETVLTEGISDRPSTFFSPNGSWFTYITKEADQSVLHLCRINGSSHVKYTDFPGEILQPIWSPDGTHIVFTGMQKGIGRAHKDLWALRVQGNKFVGEPFPVVQDVEQMEFYNWSQNGQLAYRSAFQLGGMFVLPVNPKTGKATGPPRQLARAGDISMHCWSPNGKQIAVIHHQGGWELSFISASSGEQIKKLGLATIESAGRGMSWSPDGRLIVFCGEDTEKGSGIFLITIKTGEVKLLVPLERRMPRVDPTWAPDSKTIAYGYESNIYVVNAEDGKPKMITPPAKEREIKDLFRRPVFVPNGRSVTYKAGQKILATTMNGQETIEIFHLKNNAFSIFDWAPDGRHIVFTSDTTSEIWCAPTDGSEPFQIGDISDVGNNALAQRPKWSPKGDAIAFIVNCEEYQYWVMENLLPVE